MQTYLKLHFSLTITYIKGCTKDYIDGKISHDSQLEAITNAYDNVAAKNEVVLCEGTGKFIFQQIFMRVILLYVLHSHFTSTTGHCAVGSIVGASNAKVASLLGAGMVLVANGGLVSYKSNRIPFIKSTYSHRCCFNRDVFHRVLASINLN